MSTLIANGYNIFTDKNGEPLEDGYIFIGVAGLNPISNPQQAYWDADLTIAATAIRTAGGYPVYNGSPARLYVADNYSIVVQDHNGQGVYTLLDAEGYLAVKTSNPGFDNAYVEVKAASTITIKAGSTADVDGTAAEVLTDTDLQITNVDTDYYIELLSDGTVSPVTSIGTFDADQNGWYSANGRILNWIARRDSTTTYLTKITDIYNFKGADQDIRRNETLVIESITADTIDTGQGANELYAMDQDVQSTDDVEFNDLTVANDISVTGQVIDDLDFDARILPQTGTAGSITLAALATVTFPRGVYQISPNNANIFIEVFTTAFRKPATGGAGCAVVSDGTNVAAVNYSSTNTYAVYYRRF